MPYVLYILTFLCVSIASADTAMAQSAALLPLTPRFDDSAGLPGTDPAFVESDTPADNADDTTHPDQTGVQPSAMSSSKPAAKRDVGNAESAERVVLSGGALASEAVSSSPGKLPAAPMRSSTAALPPLPGLTAAELMRPLTLPSVGVDIAHARSLPDSNALITLALDHVDLAVALKAFAEFTGLNILASDHVRGTVTLTLTRVPWRRAFDTLLDAYGLAMQQRGNVIWIATAGEVAAREKQHFEASARIAELEPLASHMFVLQYQRAEDVRKLLAGNGNQRVLSKRGTAMADPRTDHLFVTDLPERLAQVAALIESIDRPARQVLIESRIVEADESFARNLGVRLALLGGPSATDSSPAHGIQGGSTGDIYDLSAGGIGGYAAATLGTTLFSAGASRELMLELSALEATGHGRIVSSPRVVTADRVRALVEQGTELPYQAKVDTGMSAVQFRRAGLKLEVIPHITPDHHVMLDVDVTKDSVGAETTAGPAIDTKHVQTQVQVENGGTVAIGGIYIQDERRDASAVPWLGRLPLIGFLFRQSASNNSKSELMIFITPTEVSQNASLDASTLGWPAGSMFSMPEPSAQPPSGASDSSAESDQAREKI